MRWKIHGYILTFTSCDHGGTHIHVYSDDDVLGVWDMARRRPIRGLKLNRKLKDALKKFEDEIHKDKS